MRSLRNKLIGSVHNAYDLAYYLRKEINKEVNINFLINEERIIRPIPNEINLDKNLPSYILSSYSFLVSSLIEPEKLFVKKIPESRKWGLSKTNEGKEKYLLYLNEQLDELINEINNAGLEPKYYFNLDSIIYS